MMEFSYMLVWKSDDSARGPRPSSATRPGAGRSPRRGAARLVAAAAVVAVDVFVVVVVVDDAVTAWNHGKGDGKQNDCRI